LKETLFRRNSPKIPAIFGIVLDFGWRVFTETAKMAVFRALFAVETAKSA
jgi:hypothetical protein